MLAGIEKKKKKRTVGSRLSSFQESKQRDGRSRINCLIGYLLSVIPLCPVEGQTQSLESFVHKFLSLPPAFA